MEISAENKQDESRIIIEKDRLIGVENETLQNLVQSSIENGCKNISIDLTKVHYISSWGIGILIQAYTTCSNRKIGFKLQGVNENVMNVLNQLKLTGLFNIA